MAQGLSTICMYLPKDNATGTVKLCTDQHKESGTHHIIMIRVSLRYKFQTTSGVWRTSSWFGSLWLCDQSCWFFQSLIDEMTHKTSQQRIQNKWVIARSIFESARNAPECCTKFGDVKSCIAATGNESDRPECFVIKYAIDVNNNSL